MSTLTRRNFLRRIGAVPIIGKALAVSIPSADYPDFLRVEQGQGAPIYNPGPITTAGAVASGVFYVGPWSSLAISVKFTGGAGQYGGFTVAFYADQAATIQVSQPVYAGNNGSTVREVITCRGPWVRFTSSYVSGAGSSIITPLVTPLAGNQNVDNNTDLYEYLFNNQAYIANQTVNLSLTPWTPGPCLLSVQGTALFGVQMQDWSGASVVAGQCLALQATAAPWEINVPVNIGRQQPTLVVTNGAAGQNIQAGVIGAAA